MASNLTRVIRSELGRLEQPHSVLVPLLGISRRSLADRMTGKSDWHWLEVVLIASAYPNVRAGLPRAAEMDADLAAQLDFEEAAS